MGDLRFRDVLETYRGAAVYFDSLASLGNNGDRLIEQGSRHTHREFGLQYTETPAAARLILIRGNGAMSDLYPSTVLGILQQYASLYPSTPICMEPSTFAYRDLQLRDVLPMRSARTYLFARDDTSYRYLEGQRIPGSIEVGVDHDMALALRGSDLLRELNNCVPNKVLVVERLDVEHPLAAKHRSAFALAMYRLIFPPRVRPLARILVNHVRRAMPSSTKVELARLADRHYPELSRLPRLFRDVQDPDSNTFEEFLRLVATSRRSRRRRWCRPW